MAATMNLELRCPCCGCGGDDDALRMSLNTGTIECSECSEEITVETIEAAKKNLDKLLGMLAAVEAVRAAE